MDLRLTAQEEAFRAEVRAFLRDHLPDRLARKVRAGESLSKAEMEEWHAILNARGWLAAGWPREWGGPGWSAVERYIFEEECARAHAPRVVPFGVSMLGPVLIAFGTEAQKRHWLPRILNGQDWWCQGYSEPGAGSDLASLRTRAVREDGHYLVNGQKTWTTLAQHANMMFALVRTRFEGKPQEGISFLLIDMTSPGVERRPIRTIDGGQEINEVFLTDVRVPVENRVGEENQGWTIAKYLLGHERTNIAGMGFVIAAFEELRALMGRMRRDGRPLIAHPRFAARLAAIECELEALKITNLRMLSGHGGQSLAVPAMLKIRATVLRQQIDSLARQALGPAAAPFPGEGPRDNLALVPPEAARAAAIYFNNRKLSIFGGSNEIQRNIVAQDMLGRL
ncbi:MAG: pimeloyl-CoA dehydrogenase large subunit [Alphaproteobacteria bacterium]|nr:MAG: pimeloyl-CoA dehydrogenase large subunit [Alphaproteobacteria bacterium]